MELRSRNKINLDGGSSSISDLVFLLLIFFIVLSTLALPEQLKVELPSTAKMDKSTDISPKFTLTITNDEEYIVEGKTVDYDDLDEVLQKMVGDSEKAKITMVVDGDVKTSTTLNAVSIIKYHNWKVGIATQTKR